MCYYRPYRLIDQSDSLSNTAIKQLCLFIDQLTKLHPPLLPHEIQKLSYHQIRTNNLISRDLLMNMLGFDITISNSHLKDGGRGVFVNKGHIKKGHIVALYPGNHCDHTHLINITSIPV